MEEESKKTPWKGIAIAAIVLLAIVGVLYVTSMNAKPATSGTSTATPAGSADASAAAATTATKSGAECLTLWTDGSAAKTELIAYVEAVTKEGGADYIPPEDRIATFDFDGTLFCETDPNYFDYTLLVYRVLEDPNYKDKASEFERSVANKIVDQNENGTKYEELPVEHGQAVASAFKGMTVEEFTAYIQEFKKQAMPSYDGMTRGNGFYLPMLEVVNYLEANDFTVYVVSGTDRLITRGIFSGECPIDIEPARIIGSDETMVATNQGDTDGLSYTFTTEDKLVTGGEFIIKNLKMNKVSAIQREIGQQPVISFGNSSGDFAMDNYALSNPNYRSAAFQLCCDDLERENGNLEKADKMRSECAEYGYTPISMKDDWTTIYGDGVTKKSQEADLTVVEGGTSDTTEVAEATNQAA